MHIIQNQVKLFGSVIGKQCVKEHKNYRFLNFCINKVYNGKFLIFNNLTKEFIWLSAEEDLVLQETPLNLSHPLVKSLIERWFLVPQDFDDIKFSQQVTNVIRQFKPIKHFEGFTILPTTGCNARCFYCFESGSKIVNMSKEIAQDVAQFVIDKGDGKHAKLNWFGGEPLCNMAAIDTITEKLIDAKIDFKSRIVTNGYLFDDNVVKKAVNKWQLKHAQITLDGTKDNYNKIKNYVHNDPNPFGRVINNIGVLLDNGVKVSVRLNMDNHNSNDLFLLVDYLADLYGGQKDFSIYPHLLYENIECNAVVRTPAEREEISNIFFELRDRIKQYDLLSSKNKLANNIKCYYCMSDNPTSALILPNGKIGSCEHYLDSKYIGSIYSDEFANSAAAYREPQEKCMSCPCFPDCLTLADCPTMAQVCYDHEQVVQVLNLEETMIRHFEDYFNRYVGD